MLPTRRHGVPVAGRRRQAGRARRRPAAARARPRASPPPQGTADYLARFGLPVDQVVGKVSATAHGRDRGRPDRRRRDHLRRQHAAGRGGPQPTASRSARRPSCTGSAASRRSRPRSPPAQGMAERRADDLTVRSLQEYHAPVRWHRRTLADRSACGARPTGDRRADRLGRAAQPGDDRVGHGRARRRAGRATSTSPALGAVVVKSLAAFEWAGNPAPRLHPTAAGHAQRRRAAGPRRRGLAARRPAAAPARPGRDRRGQHLGPHRSTTTAPPPSCSPPHPPTSSPSRSTCRARTSRAGGTPDYR